MPLNQQDRLVGLDWLRVSLILAVFLHHVCMPFNGDNWHIMNAQSFWSEFPALSLKLSANHLWFIEYLIVFSVFSILIQQILVSAFGHRLVRGGEWLANKKTGLFSLVVLLIAMRVLLKAYLPDDSNKVENLAS